MSGGNGPNGERFPVTLCRKVRGCVHPPNHLEPCEVNGIGQAVTFLEQQERTAQLAARIGDELLIVVGANSLMFAGPLTRDALAILIQAKCKNGSNGHPIPISTVHNVLSAIASLGDFLVTPPAAAALEPSHARRKR